LYAHWLELINEFQIQDSTSLDDELNTSTLSKTAMVCKLAKVPPEIWMTLPLESKTCLLNEQRHQ
jgi:hypothetical protein